MKYARFDDTTVIEIIDFTPEGRFTPEVVAAFEPVPDAIEIGWTHDHDSGEWSPTPLPPEPAPPAPPTLDEVKAAKLAQMNALTDASLGALTSVYPQGELLTFDKQEAEARAFVADPASPTPLLSALATGRGITLDDLARRVIVKADAFSSVSGYIIGQRQALEDLLEQATTLEDVEAIQVTIAVPGSPPEPAPVPEAPMHEEPVLEAVPETPPTTDAEAAA